MAFGSKYYGSIPPETEEQKLQTALFKAQIADEIKAALLKGQYNQVMFDNRYSQEQVLKVIESLKEEYNQCTRCRNLIEKTKNFCGNCKALLGLK